eukprot:TRINITY_DN1144_c0_g1_i1.p1 TRINITY_DN1144_c0_g1~~TRINITY_DN1144_c0_g1_i1.p1  ORF type:complete len:185 (+),score=46.42 TRINITY_DN1144_c0_g1_i1:122-676(+)
MTIIDLLILFLVAAIFFLLGMYYAQRMNTEQAELREMKAQKKYAQLEQDFHDDEEAPAIPLVESKDKGRQPKDDVVSKKAVEGYQREIDQLSRELKELRAREKKYQAEIQLLKTTPSTTGSSSRGTPSSNVRKPELLVPEGEDNELDQEIHDLLGGSSQKGGHIDPEKARAELDSELPDLLKNI